MPTTELEVAIRERFDANDLRAARNPGDRSLRRRGLRVPRRRSGGRRAGPRGLRRDGLPRSGATCRGSAWDASLRTWIYTLARHRLAAHLGRKARPPTVALSEVTDTPALARKSHTPTPPWKRTEVKDAVSRLRRPAARR